MNSVFAWSVVMAVGLAVGMANGDEPTTRPGLGIRVMSFNIRNSGENDKQDDWTHRKDLFIKTIKDYRPDLLGTQEVLARQYDDLRAGLPEYGMVGVARDDGDRKGEWALLLYRKDRFRSIDSGNFWLSETPDKPGKGWDAACTRICSWVKLHDDKADRDLIFANTHWDHVGVIARRKAAELTLLKLPALSNGSPVIFTGDLNSYEDDDWVQSLLEPKEPGQVKLFDSYREVHPSRSKDERTYHGFKGAVEGSRIDFILHGIEFKATAAEIDRAKSADGHYPSDHFAVTADLQWK